MDKYYIGTGTINGQRVQVGATLSNFRGTVEEAGRILATGNPGIEDFELTENGDSERGMLVQPPPADTSRDFAEAMMSPPRTVKVKPPTATPADPKGRPFNPAVGIPREVVPTDQIQNIK